MYQVKPFYNDNLEMSKHNVMYKVNNFHDQSATASIPDTETDPLAALERKQNEIFNRLNGLKDMVNQLSTKYKSNIDMTSSKGVMTSSKTVQVQGSESDQSTVPLVSQQKVDLGDVIHDLVVSADPESPPLSLLVLYKVASEKFKVFASTFVHSSVIKMPPSLQNVFQNGDRSSREGNDVAFTLVWKKVENGPTLMVNPQNQTLIEGESNIARYIQRLLNPDFDRCVVASTKIDEWLDLAEQYVRGNKKENAAVLKSLNSKLGSSEWLVGNSVSLADIVMWSVVNQGKAQKDSPANVKNWLKRCENNVYFDMAKTVL